MENSIKQYFQIEKRLEQLNYNLELYADEKTQFAQQISKIKKEIEDKNIQFKEVLNYVSLADTKADAIRFNLIGTIRNTLDDILNIVARGKYPSLQQNLILQAHIFWDILFNIQRTLEYEGAGGASASYLRWDNFKWKIEGLEDILNNALNQLSSIKFYSFKDAIDFFTDLASRFKVEYSKVVEESYNS